MAGRRRVVAIGAVAAGALVVAATAVFVSVRRGEPSPPPPPRGGRPTIVLILTDDQRLDQLSAMPTVESELVRHGVTFANGFVDDPLCCPSRASILTGRYPDSTGVWRDYGHLGGFKAFHDDHSTIATWLHAAGYHTGLFGKYLNKYATTYVPPGWDRWVTFAGAQNVADFYYRYNLNIDGHIQAFGSAPSDYSTDVLAAQAVSFIRGSRANEGPLFVYFAPYAPHLPGTPAPSDTGAFHDLAPLRPPSFDEQDVSDKPAWVRKLSPIGTDLAAQDDALRRDSFASLLAVDRAVGEIVRALADTGRLANSLIAFTSDNGFMWGEHRWVGKVAPYEEDIHVPFVVRDDRLVGAPRTDPHPVLNVDLAPTFAAAAGVEAPGAQGKSFLPLLGAGSGASWRTDFLVESASFVHVPGYCAVRTERYLYAVYETGEEELYDLARDPYELQNLATDPSVSDVRSALRARLHELCAHPPPGFTSPP